MQNDQWEASISRSAYKICAQPLTGSIHVSGRNHELAAICRFLGRLIAERKRVSQDLSNLRDRARVVTGVQPDHAEVIEPSLGGAAF
ncbi:hypothetical protein ACJ73_01308 [Blastomyces percursus]|uniref:Uncharacterized protein n=1 Tax=Blastomyces percursus TaxID=1658174 RepID=A0A1J9QGS6_9EURO|nr:hypothetical protein ACJ73_01308 [Blastomyces percursus]